MKPKQEFLSEFLGTAALLIIVVGSGIMAENLSQGNTAIALLANSLATGLGLFVLITCLDGAHFNPVVSFIEFLSGRLSKIELLLNWFLQTSGAVTGVLLTHVMFDQKILQISSRSRNFSHLWISEILATFGLICTIYLSKRKNNHLVPVCVASYITAAYLFSSSTSFANPAVTFARMLTDTFCGIATSGVMPFVLAQFIGAIAAFFLLKK